MRRAPRLLPRSPDRTTNIVEFYYPEEIALFERGLVEAHQAAYMESAAEDAQICTQLHRGRKALHALGIHPSVLHLNEGHSAFATLEMVRWEMDTNAMPFGEATLFKIASA